MITVTSAAAAQIQAILTEDPDNANKKLRIYVQGGGCSGFEYGFTLEDTINDDDFIIEKDNIVVLVDAMSGQYLQNAVVDFTESLQGARFTVDNPGAVSTCGCGSSFAYDFDYGGVDSYM